MKHAFSRECGSTVREVLSLGHTRWIGGSRVTALFTHKVALLVSRLKIVCNEGG